MNQFIPSLFVSHGLPPMAIMDDASNSALVNFGRNIEIKGVVAISSHWACPGPVQITSQASPKIQHNFSGFQSELYELQYSPPSSQELAQKVKRLLEKTHQVELNNEYPLDYGVWMPLRMICPDADVPVVQLSLPLLKDPREVMKLGHTLGELRKEGILLLASGSAALNTSKIIWHARGDQVHPKIQKFDDWLEKNLLAANIESLINYRTEAPFGEFAHPGTSSLLPIFFTIGSSIAGDVPHILHKGFRYSATSLLSFCLTGRPIHQELFS
jgi:4,5-DOPA dioxygenase extradiol